MWHDEEVDVAGQVTTPWAIHVIITLKIKPVSWMLSGMYASPRQAKKHEALAEVMYIDQDCDFPFIVVGDFNALAFPEDTRGGRTPTEAQLSELGNVMEECELLQVPSIDGDFLWNNKQEGDTNIQEIIYPCLANSDWNEVFSDAQV